MEGNSGFLKKKAGLKIFYVLAKHTFSLPSSYFFACKEKRAILYKKKLAIDIRFCYN
jgi:hypothetical protein